MIKRLCEAEKGDSVVEKIGLHLGKEKRDKKIGLHLGKEKRDTKIGLHLGKEKRDKKIGLRRPGGATCS